jgi:hypothetical protein
MRTAEEPVPARRRRLFTSRSRVTKAALAVTTGAFVTVGLSVSAAGATTLQPETLKTCKTGSNNTYEYTGWCDGTGPTSYRVLALCENGQAVAGIEKWDGDRTQSTASCELDGMNSTLNNDWGYVLCSNNNGAGTYQGYVDRHGDISGILYSWGSGSITNGGTLLCQYDTSQEFAFNPNVAP